MEIKTINENELLTPYVDIGGIEWASCNLGASSPSEYGDYYMWGSTTPNTNDDCSWANTPFNNGSTSYNSSYLKSVEDTVCPNGVLANEYDAIYQKTDGVARMPTSDEFQSLCNNTTQEVCDCICNNGVIVKGMLFNSQIDESKKIFIPFSGYRDGSSVYDTCDIAPLWSSSLYSGNTQLAYLLICSNLGYVSPSYSLNRYCGLALRGVRNNVKKIN